MYVGWEDGPHKVSEEVERMCAAESALNNVSTYHAFADRIAQNGKKLHSLLDDFRDRGIRVVGYGSPAKATTLCYALGIDGTMIEYIVDDSPLKQGLYMPGTHIPIKAPATIYTDKPGCCLILAWNFADSIIKNNQKFIKNGGVFINPVPEPRILS